MTSRRRWHPSANIDAELAEVIADLAKDANVPGAATLQDVFLARGLDPSQPVGAFLDFSKSVAEMTEAQKGGADETKEDADEPGDKDAKDDDDNGNDADDE